MKDFFFKNKYVAFIFTYRWIWLAVFFLWKIFSIGFKIKVGGYQIGHLDGINSEGIYSLFFPLFPLISNVFPFRSVIHYFWNSTPQFLQDFRNMYFLLPAVLSMAVAAIAYPANMRISGTIALVLSLVMIQGTNMFFDIEQSMIACCILMSVGAFYSLKNYPRLRIASISAALCACMHSKGVCFPFCLIVFAMLFYETLKTKKNMRFLSICFAVFLIGGIAWSISASGTGKLVLFTEDSNRLIPNLVGGAYGLIQTIEGDVGETFNLKDATLMSAVIHSAKIVMLHPFNYIKAIVMRIVWLSGKIHFFAPLFIIFICSFFKLQHLKNFPVLFIAAAYFFCIYIIMPVETRYFVPIIFLMCSCSAVFLSDYILALKTKLCDKVFVASKENKNFTVSPHLFKMLSEYVIGGTVVLHFAAWLLSIFLLITFPYRFAAFDSEDAEKYFERNPDNVFLAFYPFRKKYPLMRDYDGMLDLYRKTEKYRCPLGFKERWLNYLAGREDLSYVQDSYCKSEIYWQDVLLSAFKDIERGGNLEKGIYDIQTAVLTCMLSSGYIRQDKGEAHSGYIRDISDNMAMSKAGVCAASYEEYVFDLSDIHKDLKHTLLHSKAYDMMFPDKVREMFLERNSEKCTFCCVSHGGGAPPDKCGITDYKIPIYNQSLRGVVPLYTYNDISAIPIWIINIYDIYEKIDVARNKEQRIRRIDSAIRILESYLSIYDEEINKKVEESPDMLTLSHLRNRPEAAYNLAKLYYLKGNKKKARKYVIDTLKFSEGVQIRPELEKKRLMELYMKCQ